MREGEIRSTRGDGLRNALRPPCGAIDGSSFERRDGIWVEDIGSTNGTFVNGIRLTRERKLTPGDVVRIGETDLRFEP